MWKIWVFLWVWGWILARWVWGDVDRLLSRVGLRAWLYRLRIRDVGGGYGFADMRESLRWAEVCGSVHVELQMGRGEVRVRYKRRQGRKLTGAEGKTATTLVGLWVELSVSLSLVCGLELRWVLRGIWTVCKRSVWGVSKSGNHLKVKWEMKWFYELARIFYNQTKFYFQFDCIFKWCQTWTRV